MDITVNQIRRDLKDIRYYYSMKDIFDCNGKSISSNFINKVNRYNHAVQDAPAQLYVLYCSLYIENMSQEALAEDWGCSERSVLRMNNKLVCFLYNKFLYGIC